MVHAMHLMNKLVVMCLGSYILMQLTGTPFEYMKMLISSYF